MLALREQQPNDPFLDYALAKEHEKLGHLGEAKDAYKELYQKHKEYLPLYYHYANFLLANGDELMALQIIQEGIQLADDQRDNHTKAELNQLLDIAQEANK